MGKVLNLHTHLAKALTTMGLPAQPCQARARLHPALDVMSAPKMPVAPHNIDHTLCIPCITEGRSYLFLQYPKTLVSNETIEFQ